MAPPVTSLSLTPAAFTSRSSWSARRARSRPHRSRDEGVPGFTSPWAAERAADVYAFARRPSMHQGRTQAAAAVIRDAFAQGWQVTPDSCLECTRECRSRPGSPPRPSGPARGPRAAAFGDASPDLIYCAEALIRAFPDARIVQVIRDGRDVVASMLADPVVMSWFRPSFVNVDTEFPNPFFGIESEDDRDIWPGCRRPPVVRCAGAGRFGWPHGCTRACPPAS